MATRKGEVVRSSKHPRMNSGQADPRTWPLDEGLQHVDDERVRDNGRGEERREPARGCGCEERKNRESAPPASDHGERRHERHPRAAERMVQLQEEPCV